MLLPVTQQPLLPEIMVFLYACMDLNLEGLVEWLHVLGEAGT